ncbi:MAG: hypothetical protein ACKVZJ_03680 [Phycisphaerales bacterium]
MKPRIYLQAGEQTVSPAVVKLECAKAYLRERGLYVLDRGSPAKWGIPGDVPTQANPLLERIMEADRRRKK